jgi:hypothetical protein
MKTSINFVTSTPGKRAEAKECDGWVLITAGEENIWPK